MLQSILFPSRKKRMYFHHHIKIIVITLALSACQVNHLSPDQKSSVSKNTIDQVALNDQIIITAAVRPYLLEGMDPQRGAPYSLLEELNNHHLLNEALPQPLSVIAIASSHALVVQDDEIKTPYLVTTDKNNQPIYIFALEAEAGNKYYRLKRVLNTAPQLITGFPMFITETRDDLNEDTQQYERTWVQPYQITISASGDLKVEAL